MHLLQYFKTKATIRSSYEGVAKDLAEQESWAIKNKATEKMLSQISCNLLIRSPDRGFKYLSFHSKQLHPFQILNGGFVGKFKAFDLLPNEKPKLMGLELL